LVPPLHEFDNARRGVSKYEHLEFLEAALGNNSKLRASRGNYETARTLLRLAVFLQGSPKGRTIKEIQAHLTCSRATANRWLEALRDTPELKPRSLKPQDGDNPTQYRWILDKRQLPVTVSPEPADIAVLEKVIGELASKRQRSQLNHLKTKLEAISNEQRREVKEVSAEDRMAYHGILVRTGFRYEIDEHWVAEVERAVFHRRVIRIGHKWAADAMNGHNGEMREIRPQPTKFLMRPIGIIANKTSSLVGADLNAKPIIREIPFSSIESIEETDTYFSAEKLPTIEQYASGATEAARTPMIHEVVIVFLDSNLEEARRHQFDANQTVELYHHEKFGHVPSIRFRARNLLSVAQDLLSLGMGVWAVSPPNLADLHTTIMRKFFRLSAMKQVSEGSY
jgi:hypothetical protein